VTADSPVKPERANYVGAGFHQKVGSNLQIGVDGYYKRANDLVDEGQFGTALIFAPFNYQHGKIYGTEVTASYQLDSLMLYGNLAYSRAQGKNVASSQFFFDPDELAYIATHYVYLDHDQRFTASGGASISSPRKNTPAVVQPLLRLIPVMRIRAALILLRRAHPSPRRW
jgi:outer membrane receptor protein involved in Fe transport